MNRTKAGWGTYFTEPLPNIGLFLCRGNNKTARMFEIAWYKYQLLQMSADVERQIVAIGQLRRPLAVFGQVQHRRLTRPRAPGASHGAQRPA